MALSSALRRAASTALLALAALTCRGAREPASDGSQTELLTLKGVTVLRLRGSPRERGYAHGYHLAPRILAVSTLYRPFLASDDDYESKVRPEVRDRYGFPPDVAEEISGLHEGMRAFFRERDGDEEALASGGMRALGRPFDELDIRCMQAIADWYAYYCSGFAAWGELAPGGPVVGRNMDFGYHPVLSANHLLIYRDRQGARRAWVSLAFPGIVGAVTGVNEDGVCVFTLDANAPLAGLREAGAAGEKMLPRTLALRRMLEEAGAEDPAHDAMAILKGTATRWGQNIFIAGPRVESDPASAGVIEQTAARTVLRTATDAPVAPGVPAFACTNHFRSLFRPAECVRYATIVRRMKELRSHRSVLDEDAAFDLLWDVKQKYMTMQSVVVDLEARRLALRLFKEPLLVTRPRVVRFEWSELAGTGR